MSWELSEFGQRICGPSGISQLMQDLGDALASDRDDLCMLGGGQPAHIPEVDAIWRSRIQSMLDSPGEIERSLSEYGPPAGNMDFRRTVANLFQREYGWNIGPENIAVTLGGQTAFFFLFNALAGKFVDGSHRHVLLPLVPEYVGYANQQANDQSFRAVRPTIEHLDEHTFKYRVDFDKLAIEPETSAICVSRPTNPTGNVLTDDEISRLAQLASQHNVPLMIDNAYGSPFPGAIFTEVTPIWNDDIVLTYSLSKIGLPGTRTGIVIAREELIESIASMTSIIGLANTNIGQSIVTPLIDSGELLRISNDLIRPFYRDRSMTAQEAFHESFDNSIPYHIHSSEGALFLWLWCENLPIDSRELYERLKSRGVIVVPGDEFFFGDDDPSWQHRHECLRVSFAMPEPMVKRGIKIIAEEVTRAYQSLPV